MLIPLNKLNDFFDVMERVEDEFNVKLSTRRIDFLHNVLNDYSRGKLKTFTVYYGEEESTNRYAEFAARCIEILNEAQEKGRLAWAWPVVKVIRTEKYS